MNNKVQIGETGIKKLLNKITYLRAISEYIWNGLDAGANQVNVLIDFDKGGYLKKLVISDNGSGIAKEQLKDKFSPFYESEKVLELTCSSNHSLPHGKNGIGRLTFYKFAHRVKWNTVYKKNDGNYTYSVSMSSDKIKEYEDTEEAKTKLTTGTIVEFDGFLDFMHEKETIANINDYLKIEFSWFLKLFKTVKILINGISINPKELEEYSKTDTWNIDNYEFNIEFIQWKQLSDYEFSRKYYLSEKGKELFKEHTGLNKQGDDFFHSIFISSAYFEGFDFKSVDPEQKSLVGKAKSDKTFKELQKKLISFLRKERKPFLKGKSEKLIKDYVAEGIIKEEDKDEFKQLKVEELKKTVKGIYEVQPQIFKQLNPEQKKTFVGFLDLILDSDEREKILDILAQITELTPEERTELQKMLKTTQLSSIIKTINLVLRRKTQIDLLKQIVYREELKAREVEHLQQIIELNPWIFGEEYALYGNCETDFNKIVGEVRKSIFNDDSTLKMDHPNSKKQVDIFAIRQETNSVSKNLLIVELKRPSVYLDYDEITQIKKYRDAIVSHDQLNGKNLTWRIILAGKRFAKSNSVVNERKKFSSYGELGLIDHMDNSRLYILTWNEIINDFDIKHNFILKELETKKASLISQVKTADEAVDKSVGLAQY